MDALLNVSLPFFGMVFAGYGAARFRLLEAASTAGLNAFVFWFALPAMLFVKMATAPVADAFDWRFAVSYSGGGLISFFGCVIAARLIFASRGAVSGIQGMAAAFPNVGYMGLPIVLSLFGERAVLLAVLVIVLDHVVLLPVTTAMVEAGSGRHASILTIFKRIFVGLARNPLIIATAAGLIWGAVGIRMPVPLEAFGNLFAAAAGPCALFALGASLGERKLSDGLDEIALLCAFRLLVHPLSAWFLGAMVLDLDPFFLGIAVIEASLPIAANVFIMARAYDTYVDRTSAAVLVSTILAVVTVSCFIGIVTR